MASNSVKSEENKSKRKKELENEISENPRLSYYEKTDATLSESSQSLHKNESLEQVLDDASREINDLLSKYAHILSERAAMDASYVTELEGILKEACSIENHLKSKRGNLRQRFAALTGSLQNENVLADK